MIDEYKISLKYYQGGVLDETYETVKMIANEPDLDLTFERNKTKEGVFQEFSGTFIFILADRQWLIDKRNDYLNRLDADTKILVELYTLDRITLNYDLTYSGRSEMNGITIDKHYVEVQFEEDNILNNLAKIEDEDVTIEKDGIAYDYEISNNAVENAHQIMLLRMLISL